MGKERGFTLVELMVVLGLLALMAGIAGWVGINAVVDARATSAAAQFARDLTIAREQAIARYRHVQVVLAAPGDGADAVQAYTIRACNVPAGATVCADSDSWSVTPPVAVDRSVGIRVVGGGPTVTTKLVFDRTGRFLNAGAVVLEFCPVRTVGGKTSCQPGAAFRTITVQNFTGMVDM